MRVAEMMDRTEQGRAERASIVAAAGLAAQKPGATEADCPYPGGDTRRAIWLNEFLRARKIAARRGRQ